MTWDGIERRGGPQDISYQMHQGFEGLHIKFDRRIDELRSDFIAHREPCLLKFAEVEKALAVKEATNGVKEIALAKGVQLRSYLTRIALGAILIAILAACWKLFVGHIEMVKP